MNNQTNVVGKDDFINLLNAISESGDIMNDNVVQNHPELNTILQTILYTKCEVNTDYADLLGFVKSSELVRYCIAGHKGSKAMFYTMESAIQSVLKMDEKATGFVVHMSLPMQFSFDELVEMNEKLELWMEDDGDVVFQLDISPNLRSDEVWVHMLCGINTKENQ